MKKTILSLGIIMTALTLSVDAEEWELTDHPILTFEGIQLFPEIDIPEYKVKLKGVKFWQNEFNKSSQLVTVSYIVTINYPFSKIGGTFYVRLLDEDGFEIVSKSLGRVVENYTGTIKGKFALKPREYQRIAGAELKFMVT